MNTGNSKTNESNKFIYQLTNLILNLQITKILDWLIEIFATHGKILNLHTTTINLNFQLPLRNINLICLMVLIHFLKLKITLNLSSKNTKLWLKILP